MELNQFIPHLILLCSSLVLFEYGICHAFWLPVYYRYGIPCFYMKFEIKNSKFSFNESELSRSFKKPDSYLYPVTSILFKKISENECAFREALRVWGLYLPIVHGFMVYKPEKRLVVLKWKFNYLPVSGFLIVILLMSNEHGYLNNPLASIFLAFFGIQIIRYLFISFKLRLLLNKDNFREGVA